MRERNFMVRFGSIFKTLRLVILTSFVLCVASKTWADAQPTAGSRTQGIAWFHDLYEAHKASASTGKPMLIVFGAGWCHYCRELDTKTLTNPQLAAYIESNFIPVHLDADKDKRLAEILKAKPIPCTVVLSPDANLVGKFLGYEEVQPYFAKLEKARQQYVRMQQQLARKSP
jgi:thiol-disulfide isomerase/thioredoxin